MGESLGELRGEYENFLRGTVSLLHGIFVIDIILSSQRIVLIQFLQIGIVCCRGTI